MKAEIISVGTELLLGSTINTDAADVSKTLSEYGINVYWHTVVGDNPARVADAVSRAMGRADMIITTGGLGPTCDDLTKVAIADALGLPLVVSEEEEKWLKELFAERGNELTPNNFQQIELPKGAVALRNDWGTAPGCYLERENVKLIMLPGPPRECREMLEHRVRPILAKISDGKIVSHTVNFFGIGESEMEQYLRADMESMQNPSLAPYAREGECYVRVTAKAETEEIAEEMIKPVISKVREKFGELAYGENSPSLAYWTLKLLKEQNKTLAAAESCTGGMLSELITDIPGASANFLGAAVVYTNEVKTKLLGIPEELIDNFGAVSEEVAAVMAMNVRELLGSDYGIGITGLAGPDGDGENPVGTVFVALASENSVYVRSLSLGGRDRRIIRLYSCQNAFDMLRRKLTDLRVEEVIKP